MKRRTTLIAAAAWAGAASAQVPAWNGPATGPWRIGWLSHHNRGRGQLSIDIFTAQMRVRGFEASRDYVLDVRYADGSTEQMGVLAAELAALKPALLVAPGSSAVAALLLATRTLPILGIGMASPVETGMVQTFSRPGGNLTGNTFSQPAFAGKMIEVLKVAAPRAARVAVIWNPAYTGMRLYASHAERAAAALGMTVHYLDVKRAEDFRVQDLDRMAPDALFVVYDYAVAPVVDSLIAIALDRKLPSIGTLRQFPVAGGLMSLDPDPDEMFAVAADYAIRILKGASPATLPIQEPTRYHLIVNAKTAQALKLAMSHELLLRANEVIA